MITRCTIALSLDGDELPTEFRLFKKGWNATKKGKFLFDDTAAKSVMAAYKAWDIDVPIDLEHQMLQVEAGAPDPTARDARGWCHLELRNGELWACDVKWTSDGAQRLTNKTQRYISPAFESDPKTRRVVSMINIAITALPATLKTPALVAASAKGTQKMDPALIKSALEAVEKGDAKAALEILKGLIASAAGAEPEPDGDEPGGENDGAEGVAPPPEMESTEEPKIVPANDAPPPADEDDEEDTPEKKTEKKAMRALLCRLTGTKTMASALVEVGNYRASHMTLSTERQKLNADRAIVERAERRQLVTELVRLGAEFPATVWADDKATTIKPRWLKMPIVELREHVAAQRTARKGQKLGAVIKPGSGTGAPVELSAAELQICTDMKCDPKDFAELKALRATTDSEFATAQRAREANAYRQGAQK